MEPVIAQSIAALISALATVALMAGTYYFGSAKRAQRRQEQDDEAQG